MITINGCGRVRHFAEIFHKSVINPLISFGKFFFPSSEFFFFAPIRIEKNSLSIYIGNPYPLFWRRASTVACHPDIPFAHRGVPAPGR